MKMPLAGQIRHSEGSMKRYLPRRKGCINMPENEKIGRNRR